MSLQSYEAIYDHGQMKWLGDKPQVEEARVIVTTLSGLPLPIDEWLKEALGKSGVESLPVTCEIATRAVALPEIHRDPADRIIIATALVHEAKLASVDSFFPAYQELQQLLVGE